MKSRFWVVVVCGAFALAGGAVVPLLANGQHASSSSAGHLDRPPVISPKVCPHGTLPLPADAVAVAARVALATERAQDRPRILAAALADHGGPRGRMVRGNCGRRVWHHTVAVAIDLRRYHPSASLSERVSFVDRTRAGYAVYALGH